MIAQETPLIPEPKRFPRRQRVSLLLEATALAQGMETLRVGSRGFTAGSSPSYSEIGFQDTLNLETSRAAVRTSADRLMRKIALSEAGVAVAPSRQFGHKHVDEALDFAQRFRRGVLFKPRFVGSAAVDLHPLKEPDKVREAISSSRKATGSHATYLIERRIFGRAYTFYIVGDQVVSAARFGPKGWQEEIYRAGSEGFGEVEPEVLSLALRAFRSFPAMPHGEIRMMCPGDSLVPDRCVVVSVSPEIGLLHLRQPRRWSAHLAEQIVTHSVRNRPDRRREDRNNLVTAEFTMNEVPDPSNLAKGVRRWFSEADIDGSVRSGDREVYGTVTASPGQVVTFSALCHSGKLSASRPQSVALTHVRNES